MGTRLNVIYDDGIREYECPHKYYGYKSLKDSKSYHYLHDILKVSKDYEIDDLQGLYEYWAPVAGPYELTEFQFEQFVKFYCEDCSKVYPGEKVGGLEELKSITKVPGSKDIEWR